MDLTKLSDADLVALRRGDLAAVSDRGLKLLSGKAEASGFDPAKVDPTEGMSTADRFFAGAGKAMTDVMQGVSQFLPGGATREDVAAKRATDAPLMRTGAGMAGNITGSLATLLPTAFIPGAATIPGAVAIGAGTGLVQPSESTGETLKNTGIGGAAGAGGVLLGRGIGAVAQGAKGLIEPFTSAGQKKIAAATLREFASDPKAASAALRDAKQLVPGSVPTMAQASGDSGLAQLERTLANNPESAKALEAAYATQRAARLKSLQDVAGTDEFYNAIKAGRKLFAGEDYGKAISQGIDTEMAKALKPQVQSLLGRPSMQAARHEAMKLAREQDIALTDFGSIEGLDWLKKGLDAVIEKASNPANSAGKTKLAALTKTKQDLMDVIESIAPAYKAANDNFAAMSRQVNSMDAARELLGKYQPALGRYGASTREHADAYASALESSLESVKKSTGMNKPLSDVMNADDVLTLQNIAKDLGRQAKAADLGRARGSNTAQNLAAQNLLRRTLGPTGLPQSWSENSMLQAFLSPYTGIAKLAGSEAKVLERLAQAATDPQEAAALLLLSRNPDLIERAGARLLPYSAPVGLLSTNSSQ